MAQQISEKELARLLEQDKMVRAKKEKEREYSQRREAYRTLMVRKAEEKGITVSDKEIEEELARLASRKRK